MFRITYPDNYRSTRVAALVGREGGTELRLGLTSHVLYFSDATWKLCRIYRFTAY